MILGSKPIVVTRHSSGEKETVEVRRLTLRQLYTFIEYLGGKDSPALVSMCTGKPVAWIDELTDDSYFELVEACHNENFQRAADLARRDPIAAVKFAAFAQDSAALGTLMDLAKKHGLPGLASSDAPAPSVSAEASSNAASISPQTSSA